jgi:hypothetical protein
MEISAGDRAVLACDHAEGATWLNSDGADRAAYFIRWDHGQAGRYSPFLHNPAICLAYAGMTLIREEDPVVVEAQGFRLPFRAMRFSDKGREFSIFFCTSGVDSEGDSGLKPLGGGSRSWLEAQLGDVIAGRRNVRTRLLAVALWGLDDASARSALAGEVRGLLRREKQF